MPLLPTNPQDKRTKTKDKSIPSTQIFEHFLLSLTFSLNAWIKDERQKNQSIQVAHGCLELNTGKYGRWPTIKAS